jgi:diguanylate cyclase (GGDEF)-like protein/PAS domain S-box-containing protein
MEKRKSLKKVSAENRLTLAQKELKRLGDALKRFEMAAEQSAVGIIIADIKGIIQFVNKAWADMHGFGINELNNKHLADFIVSEKNKINKNDFMENVIHSGYYQDETIHKKKDGTEFPMLTTVTLLRDEKGIPVGFAENSQDISKRKSAEKALHDNEEKYRSLHENALVGMVTADRRGGIIGINELASKMLGYPSKEEVISKVNICDVFSDVDAREDFFANIFEKGQIIDYETRLFNKEGEHFWAEVSFKWYKDEGFIDGILIDISKRKNAEERIYNLTYYDQLTKLPNKEFFKTRIQNEILKIQRRNTGNIFAVMCLGINSFKSINTIYGPEVGDILLTEIAHRLSSNVYDKDMVSRFDGDKFMILFSDIASRDDAGELIKKITEIFSDVFKIDDNHFTIGASMGICIYPEDGITSEIIIKNSEAAMFMAKEQGKVTHFFDPKLNEEVVIRFQLEKELQQAIADNEFIAFFQPKVMYDGDIVGMESLIRWNSSNRGLVLPYQFISIAERNSLITEIGNIILEQACTFNKRWQKMGYKPLRVSVNLSPFQFSQKNLVNDIKRILKRTDLEPKWLEIEITESGIFKNEKESIEKMFEIHKLGISISIDDFGTGYSSLSKLKDYPIDILKIDKSIIDGIPASKTSSIITTTIIDLAHNLGFSVVAEGVEKKDQLDFLVFHKCDQFQGYYFSKPVSPDEFEKKLKYNK